MTAKTSISLTDAQSDYARGLVKAGQFPSVSAVLQHGLELLRRHNEEHDLEIEALRALLAQRRSGEFIDLDTGEADTHDMLNGKRKARAAAL